MIYMYSSIVLAVMLAVSTYYAFKFAFLILKFQEALEDSLEVIDAKYSSISAICERPLFFDSPEVRNVLSDIRETRDSLHRVAIVLSKDFDAEDAVEETRINDSA